MICRRLPGDAPARKGRRGGGREGGGGPGRSNEPRQRETV